jgi:type VI secretion system secreted protein Hcp
MAVNAYLVIDGRPGPSTSKPNAIDILSFSFGASNSSVIGAGSSGGEARAGRANLGDVTVMKVLDKTSPLLFDDCCTGNYLSKVDIIYDKPMGDNQEDYFKIPSSCQDRPKTPSSPLALPSARSKSATTPRIRAP